MELTLQEEINKLGENEIIPQIVKNTPIKSIIVKYGMRCITMGDLLTPVSVKDKPSIEYYCDDKENENYFTLILINADEPSRTNRLEGETKHWLITNIKGNKVSKGEELVEYLAPLPPVGTGLHRLIFILCKQPSKLDFKGEFKIPFTLDNRKEWNSNEFINKWKLTIEAVNYFECQYDEFVLTTNEQLLESKEKSKII